MPVVTYDVAAPIATVTMDDGKANALSFEMFDALHAALDAAETAGCGVVLAGRPGRFCAGFHLPTLGSGTPEAARLLRAGFALASRMRAFPRPIVAACTGHAYAMGAFLLLAADYRVGADDAAYRITANEVALGITMPQAAVLLCGRLHPAYLERVVVQAEVFAPEGARAAGLLDETVAEAEVLAVADAKARQLRALDGAAFAATKRRVHGSVLAALPAAMDADEREFLTAMGGQQHAG